MEKSLDIDNRAPEKTFVRILKINPENFPFKFPITHFRFSNIHAECGKRGICNKKINQ